MTRSFNRRSSRATASLQDVAELAMAADPVALAVLDEGAAALGVTLAGLSVALDVRTLVLGGGVASLGETYRARVAAAVEATLPHELTADVRLSGQGTDASVAGAGALVLHARR